MSFRLFLLSFGGAVCIVRKVPEVGWVAGVGIIVDFGVAPVDNLACCFLKVC